MNTFTDYDTRARELMFTHASQRRAFVVLNEYADAAGACPACGGRVSRSEHERVTHARTCTMLQADAALTAEVLHPKRRARA